MTIKELRAQTGLSQSRFAERYGIPVKTIQAWEAGRFQPADYIVDMLEKLIAQEDIELKAWVFSEYRDSRGTGSEKLFKDRDEAVKYAEEEWNHLSVRDQESYHIEDGDVFLVAEAPVYWDDVEEKYEPDLSSLDPVWSAI